MHRRDFLRNLVITSGGLVLAPTLLSACGGSSETTVDGLAIGTPTSPLKLDLTTDPIANGLASETGTMEVLNWADYVNPDSIADFEEKFNCKINITIYDTEESAIAKLRNGTFQPDLIIGMTEGGLSRLVAADILQPLNKSYIPNFANVIAGLQNPYYDQGSQYTVPYFIYGNGIGYRTDRIDPNVFASGKGYDVLWDPAHKGRLAIVDSYRDALSMAILRGGSSEVNTGDPALLAKAGADLIALREATNPKVDIVSYQELPAGNRDVAFMWSGDILGALAYLPEGTPAETLGFWYPPDTVTANDFMCVTKTSKTPVLAHQLINYLTDTANAMTNREWVGYQPALETITVDSLIASGSIPDSLVDALVTPERYAAGNRMVALAPEVDSLWLDQWTAFTAG